MADTTATTASATNGPSIGIIAEVKGHATITHPDGTHADITKGMQVFKGDQIETDAQGAVNITFEDNTVFAVSNNAQMAIDEFIYDADKDGQGDAEVSVMRGIFVYTSGFVGKEDPSDVHIKTPVGSIGIRGTILTGYIPPEGSGEEAKISLIEGAIVVRPTGGGEFALNTPRETVQIDTATGQGTNIGLANAPEMLDTYNIVRSVAPALFEPIANPAGTTPHSDAAPQGENNVPVAEDAAIAQTAENTDGDTKADAPTDSSDSEVAATTNVSAEPNTTTESAEKAEIPTTATDPMTDMLQGDGTTLPLNGNLIGPLDARAPDGLLSPQVGALLGVDSGNMTGTAGPLLPPPPIGMMQPPPPPGMTPDTIMYVDTNHAPVNRNISFTAYEQAGLGGQTDRFNIGRFFYDPDGNALSYKITNIVDVSNAISGAYMTGSTLNFNVRSDMATDTTISITLAAYDGKLYSGTTNFSFPLYTLTPAASVIPTDFGDGSSGSPLDLTESNKKFSMLGGNDYLNVNNSGNIIFGGLGNDTIKINSGSGHKIYGDSGDDVLKIVGVEGGNLLSGGMGNDHLWIDSSGAGHELFGSDGDDTFHLNSSSLGILNSNQTLIDGGSGFDTVKLGSTDVLDLTAIDKSHLHNINAIRMVTGGGSTVCVDILDILHHTDSNSLFISGGVDSMAASTVNVSNVTGLAALTYKGDVTVDGDTFHSYSNGKQSLYIDTDITTVTGL